MLKQYLIVYFKGLIFRIIPGTFIILIQTDVLLSCTIPQLTWGQSIKYLVNAPLLEAMLITGAIIAAFFWTDYSINSITWIGQGELRQQFSGRSAFKPRILLLKDLRSVIVLSDRSSIWIFKRWGFVYVVVPVFRLSGNAWAMVGTELARRYPRVKFMSKNKIGALISLATTLGRILTPVVALFAIFTWRTSRLLTLSRGSLHFIGTVILGYAVISVPLAVLVFFFITPGSAPNIQNESIKISFS